MDLDTQTKLSRYRHRTGNASIWLRNDEEKDSNNKLKKEKELK